MLQPCWIALPRCPGLAAFGSWHQPAEWVEGGVEPCHADEPPRGRILGSSRADRHAGFPDRHPCRLVNRQPVTFRPPMPRRSLVSGPADGILESMPSGLFRQDEHQQQGRSCRCRLACAGTRAANEPPKHDHTGQAPGARCSPGGPHSGTAPVLRAFFLRMCTLVCAFASSWFVH